MFDILRLFELTSLLDSSTLKAFVSLLIYRIVIMLLLPVILLLLLLRSRSNQDYRHRWSERLGLTDPAFQKNGIIVHAASVGEVLALRPFIEELLVQQSDLAITVTTFTPTGSAQVTKIWGDKVQHCYLPLDFFIGNWLFLKALAPKAMIFMETELWPSIIAQAKRQQVKLQLVNGRLSKHSVKQYKKLSWLIKPTLLRFDSILCQSNDNLDYFIELGASKKQCQMLGNLKYDISTSTAIENKRQELAKVLPKDRGIWVVASTHAGDEEIALTAFKEICQSHDDLLLVLVPRHPERFDEVALLCEKNDFVIARRSKEEPINQQCHIWLLDSLGELMSIYAEATIVTMGGSFSDIGGHNPLEPALFKKPVIVGPRMDNFGEVFEQLKNERAIVHLDNGEFSKPLAREVSSLLKNENQARTLGENAFNVVKRNQGATALSLDNLSTLLQN